MLKDITIGQYFPGNSFVHNLDPRMKIFLTMLFVVLLFIPKNPIGILVGGCWALCGFLNSKIKLKLLFKSIKPVIPIIIFTTFLNMFFIKGTIIFSFYFIEISYEGVMVALLMSERILFLIAGTSLLTYTTSPILLTDGIEHLLKPFKRIGVPAHELAMMMTIALRFIPTLIEETDKIISAQKARGADMESGGIVKRSKALIPVLIPLFISAFRRADELALAMECRCYRGGEGRTRLRVLKYGNRDAVALVSVLIAIAFAVYLNTVLPSVYI